jgi:hypothetical protein
MRAIARRAASLVILAGAIAGCGGGSSHAARSNSATAPRMLGTATWQGMRITARAAPASAFVIFDGTSEQTVRPARHGGVQLSVTLADSQTGVAIPYATVTATLRRGTKVVAAARLSPMITPTSGPAYVTDTALPAAESYRLGLEISPPVSARHVEYQHVWLRSHSLSFAFRWEPSA